MFFWYKKTHWSLTKFFSCSGTKEVMFMFLCFFELSSVFFCWTDSDVRRSDIYFSKVCFLCFLCILGCQKLPIGKALKMTARGKHSLRVGWRNFFPVVLLCQFLVLAGNRFWFYILMYLEYNTVVVLVVLVFWFWREMVFDVTYVLSVQYSCAVLKGLSP